MYGLATQRVEGLLRIYILVVCQALLRMSLNAKAAPRGSAAGQPKERMEQAVDVQMGNVQSAINNFRTSVWLTGLRSRWCLPPLSPCRSRPWKSRQHG